MQQRSILRIPSCDCQTNWILSEYCSCVFLAVVCLRFGPTGSWDFIYSNICDQCEEIFLGLSSWGTVHSLLFTLKLVVRLVSSVGVKRLSRTLLEMWENQASKFKSRHVGSFVQCQIYIISHVPVLKVWMDGHGWRPGTYFQYVLSPSYFLGKFGGILESVKCRPCMHCCFRTLSTAIYSQSLWLILGFSGTYGLIQKLCWKKSIGLCHFKFLVLFCWINHAVGNGPGFQKQWLHELKISCSCFDELFHECLHQFLILFQLIHPVALIHVSNISILVNKWDSSCC